MAQWRADSGPFFMPGLYQNTPQNPDLGGTFSGLVKKRKKNAFSLLKKYHVTWNIGETF